MNNKTIWIIIVIIFILIFAIGGYFLYQNFCNRDHQNDLSEQIDNNQTDDIENPAMMPSEYGRDEYFRYCDQISPGRFQWKKYSNEYISFEYPDFLDIIEEISNGKELSLGPTEKYKIVFRYHYFDYVHKIERSCFSMWVSIIKTKENNILGWEENECKDEEKCLHYDSKNKIEDRFDEHYRYDYSALIWDNIRQGNTIINFSVYDITCYDSQKYIRKHFVETLEIK